jgi:hypothetical protein
MKDWGETVDLKHKIKTSKKKITQGEALICVLLT